MDSNITFMPESIKISLTSVFSPTQRHPIIIAKLHLKYNSDWEQAAVRHKVSREMLERCLGRGE